MKKIKGNRLSAIGMLVIVSCMIVVSCKKDDDIDTPFDKVAGTFYGFEATINGDLYKLPTEDDKIDIKVEDAGDQKVTVTVTHYNQDNPEALPPYQCIVGKDEDGFTVLKEEDSGNVLVLYYDKETIQCLLPNFVISASKDGKMPDWWEDE